MLDWLRGISESISGLADSIGAKVASAIIDPLQTLLLSLFIPSEDDARAIMDEFLLFYEEKFAFVAELIKAGKYVADLVITAEPQAPVIYADFDAADNNLLNMHGKVAVLDLSWYSRYKPYVDPILSASLWIFFFWRMFLLLPGIISAVGGSVESWGHGAWSIKNRSNSSGSKKTGSKRKG